MSRRVGRFKFYIMTLCSFRSAYRQIQVWIRWKSIICFESSIPCFKYFCVNNERQRFHEKNVTFSLFENKIFIIFSQSDSGLLLANTFVSLWEALTKAVVMLQFLFLLFFTWRVIFSTSYCAPNFLENECIPLLGVNTQ